MRGRRFGIATTRSAGAPPDLFSAHCEVYRTLCRWALNRSVCAAKVIAQDPRAHRATAAGAAGLSQPQIADEHVDDVGVGGEVVAPHQFEQLRAG